MLAQDYQTHGRWVGGQNFKQSLLSSQDRFSYRLLKRNIFVDGDDEPQLGIKLFLGTGGIVILSGNARCFHHLIWKIPLLVNTQKSVVSE